VYSAKNTSKMDELLELASGWGAGPQGSKKPSYAMTRAPTLSSLEPILFFVHQNEEAVRRAVKLSKKEDLPGNLCRIFCCLLDYLGHQYIRSVLESTLYALIARTVKPKKLQFFEVTQQVNQIVILIQRHFHVEIMPFVSQSTSILAECQEKKTSLFSLLEEKISDGLEQCLIIIISHFERQLGSDQGRNDFRLDDDDIDSINKPTSACVNAINYVTAQVKDIRANLDGKNMNVVLEELGMRLQRVLLEHFKKFVITQGMGGMKLKRDMQEYRQCAQTYFPFRPVLAAFEMLNDIASIHLISPSQIRHLIEESSLSRMPRSQVLEYIKLRSDYKSSWVNQYKLLESK
jgi:hypothetical protein